MAGLYLRIAEISLSSNACPEKTKNSTLQWSRLNLLHPISKLFRGCSFALFSHEGKNGIWNV